MSDKYRTIKQDFREAYDEGWREVSQGDAEEAKVYLLRLESIIELADELSIYDRQTMHSQINLLKRGIESIS